MLCRDFVQHQTAAARHQDRVPCEGQGRQLEHQHDGGDRAMSAIPESTFHNSRVTRGRLRRLLVPLAVLAAALVLAFGLRVGTSYGQAWWTVNHRPMGPKAAPKPTNPRLQNDTGI